MASLRGTPLQLYPPFVQPSFSNFTINSGGGSIDRLSWVLQMPPDVTDTLTHIGFRYGTRTGTPVAHDIGFQGFGATRLPDGTWLGGGSPKKGSFTPPADTTWNSTAREIALDNSHTFARGEILCIVCEPTGTPDGSNNSSFTRHITKAAVMPYNATQTDGGSWTRNTNWPCIWVKSATRVYGWPCLAVFSTNIATNGHRQANKLTLPAGSGDTKQCIGLHYSLGNATAGGSLIFGVWNAAGTAQTAITVDTDGLSAGEGWIYFDDTPVNINFGTAYYYGIERVDVNSRLDGIEVNAADDMGAYPMGTACVASAWDTSSWSDTTTRRFLCNPIFEDMTEPSAAGGGLLVHGGMVGGIRG
jgi:hypothetical protein